MGHSASGIARDRKLSTRSALKMMISYKSTKKPSADTTTPMMAFLVICSFILLIVRRLRD
jgi:hypothetical protein